MKDVQTVRFSLIAFALVLWPDIIITAEVERSENESQELRQNSTGGEEFNEQFYEWSVWSPCSRTCGIGIKFKGQLCLRENKALCEKKSRTYETCNTQPCPQGSKNFRDVQCGQYNGRDIFINGERATWMSYVRGDNQCLLFCYPYGEELFYYFGRVRDGTRCSKEPYGVCVFGRCKPVGCDNKLESGIHLDKCRVCGGNSTTCQPIRGRVERSPTHFERLTGYAELMVIRKGSTSVFLTDTTWNYLALRRQNGEYIVNGNRIVNWSGVFKVGDLEVQYKRLSNNIGETIQIFGPTREDLFVTSLLITGKLNTTFEYWKPIRVGNIAEDAPEAEVTLQANHSPLQMGWGSWTACSASCGGGIKVRARYPSIKSFREKDTEVKKCNVEPCDKMVAAWSEWRQWDDCSATCGGGARIRFRYCKKHGASARSGCPGKRYEVELCNVETCPEEEIRPISSGIEGRPTEASSQALQTKQNVTRLNSSAAVTASSPNATSVKEAFSESSKMPRTVSTHTKTPKIPSASHLSSQSFQNPDVSTESRSEGVRQKTLSRVQERYFSSSTLNVILLESSTEQAIPFGSDVSTATQKEVSTLPSKSLGEDVHQQKLSQSSVKEELSLLSVSRVTQSTVTSAKLLSTSSQLPGFVYSANNITRTTVAIFPTIRPSPLSTQDCFAITRQLKSPTPYSIQSSSILVSGVAIPSDVLSEGTVSIYGSEKRFSDKKPVLVSSSKDEAFNSSSLVPFTSHSMEAINTSSTVPYPRTWLQKTRYVVTDIIPTPFVYGEKSTVMNSSLPTTVDQTSVLGSTKIWYLKPLISLDDPSKTILSSSKHEELSPPLLYVSLNPMDMDSLSSSSSMQHMLLSPFSQSSSAQEVKPTKRHLYSLMSSLERVQSSPSWRFSSALQKEGTESRVDSVRSSPLTKRIPPSLSPLLSSSLLATKSVLGSSARSIWLKFSPSENIGAITGLLDALKSSSSEPQTGNTIFPQLSSPLEALRTTSIINSRTSLPSTQHLKEESAATNPVDSLQSLSSSHYSLLSPYIRASSTLAEQSTMSYLESSASLLSRQQVLLSVPLRVTSALKVESTIRSSSLHSLQVSSPPKVEITRRFIDSLRPSPSQHEMASMFSPQLSSASKKQITGSIMDLATYTSSKYGMPSLSAPRTSLAPKVELNSSFTALSRKLEIQSSPSPQVSSTLKDEVTKSLTDSVRTSLSKDGMQLWLPPKTSPTSKVADAISLMNSSRTSPSKHEMQSLVSSQVSPRSKPEVTTSLTVSMRTSLSKHDMQPLLSPKASSTPKLEVTTSLMDSMRISLSNHEMQPLQPPKVSSTEVTTSLVDSVIISSKHDMPLLPSPLVNSVTTVHVELPTTIMASLTTSSSMEKNPSLSSLQATSAPKVEFTTSPLESFRTSLSSPSLLSSSATKVEIKTSVMDLFSISLLKHRTPSLPLPQLRSGATTRILEDSITSSSSRHHPLTAIQFTTAINGSLSASLSKQEMPSLASPHAVSLPKDEFKTSLMESFRTSLLSSLPFLVSISTPKVEIKTSVIDLFSSSSLKHETPSLSTLQLSSELTTRIQEDPLTSSSVPHHQILEVASTKSLKVFLTSSLSKQHVISSFSPHLSSLVKVEAPNCLLNSSTALSSRQRSLSSTFALNVESAKNVLDALISSSSRQISSQLSSALKEEASTTLMHSVTSSPSGHHIVLSISQRFSSTLEFEATTNSFESLTSSLSRQHMLSSSPRLSPPLTTETATAIMDSIINLSSWKKLLSPRSSQLNPSIEAEYTSGLKDSPRSLSPRQPILSSTAPKLRSALKVDATTSHMESMSTSSLSRKRTLSSISPQFRSVKKDKLSPSLVGSFTSSLTEQYMLSSVSTVQTSKLPTKPSASKVNSFPIPSIFMSSIFNEEDYTFFPTSTSSLLSPTPTLESSQSFLISSSSLYTSVLQERSTTDQSVRYERHFTNSLREGDSSFTLVSREETVTATVDAPSIPSSALKTQVSSSEPSSVNVAAAPTPTAVQEEKSTEYPPCDLSQRLKEKYCYSDYAILVRIRSDAVVYGNQTSYDVKVRKVYKTNKPMKKKPEIRFNHGRCNCRTDLFMKRDYLVFGKHVPWNGTVGFLEVNKDSFVTDWDGTLESEIEQLEGYCSLISMIPTPLMSSTVTPGSGTSWQSANKAATTALMSTRSNIQVATPSSRDRTEASTTEPPATTSAFEEKCGPCEIVIKRTRAYCMSDFVIHVKILSEAVSEFNHDANYRVRLIHTFKFTSGVATVNSVWILGNQCHCPLLLPGKQYLLMGRLGMRADSSEPIAEINRESYVEVWKTSMIRRLPALKKRCPLKTTQTSTLVTESTRLTTAAIPSTTETRTSTEKILSQLPTTQPTVTPPGKMKCRRPCRITKKRNKSYCESDFVIRARVLKASFNDTLRERKYLVRIIKEFKSIVVLQVRENIFVVNDECQCPNLEVRKQYVIMGTVETISITDTRLVIPPRPFVWMWKSRMEAGLKSVTCGN